MGNWYIVGAERFISSKSKPSQGRTPASNDFEQALKRGKSMDGQRFDALTRSLAAGMPRRRVLKGLLGGTLGGLLTARHLDRVSAGTVMAACTTHDECGPCELC